MPLAANLTFTKHRANPGIVEGSPLSFTKPGFNVLNSDLKILACFNCFGS